LTYGRPDRSRAHWTRHSLIDVHRDQRRAVALDAGAVAERRRQGLPEGDADVLDGVVAAGLEVAARGHLDVDQRVPGQQGEHVVEEADPRGDRGRARAVEVDPHAHVGLAGDPVRLPDPAHEDLRRASADMR
jgi:hypothetical protein